ncbi:hypothetical protein ACI2L1_10985 [Streptomyces sp. NPDC019531]|uniref:hypothetical protein n=1 Tax=Streptomyces sp. NPDC019531 TaxID=3365062 RepID=UPI0038509B47
MLVWIIRGSRPYGTSTTAPGSFGEEATEEQHAAQREVRRALDGDTVIGEW